MNIPLPTTFNIKDAKDNKATLVIEPCYPGYGVTLGNSLRRVLLSSIDGAAITAFKVKGVQHEFSTLPYIKEDMVELMLNLKTIRLRVFADEPITLNLNIKGEKLVTAADIEKNAQVEIANPQAPIATLTDKDASLEMELIVQKGTGYVTVEDRAKEKVDIGTIMIDALFSPVVKVGFEIENVRVGQRTDYERLILKIETDNTITPQEAITRASEILVQHFQYVQDNTTCEKKEKKAKKEEKEEKRESAPRRGSGQAKDAKAQKPETEEMPEKVAEKKDEKFEEIEEKPKKKRGRPKKSES